MRKFVSDAEGLASDLDRWTYFLKHGEALDPATLPEALKVPEIHRAVGVLDVISQTEIDRREYQRQLDRRRDEVYLQDALQERAKAQLLACGELMGQIKLLERLLGDSATPQADLDAMSMDELTQRVESLLERLSSRSG